MRFVGPPSRGETTRPSSRLGATSGQRCLLDEPVSIDASDSIPVDVAQVLHPYGVGIDCHSKFIAVCVLVNTNGQVLRVEREFGTEIPNLHAAAEWITSQLARLGAPPPPPKTGVRYTIESTGCYHLPVLAAFGGLPSVVNPLLASPTRRKTDRLDARLLAYHALTGLWPTSFIAPVEVQALRIILRARQNAAQEGLRARNRLTGVFLKLGHTFTTPDPPDTPAGRAIIEDFMEDRRPVHPGVANKPLPDHLKPIVKQLMDIMDDSAKRAKASVKQLASALSACEFITQFGECISGPDLYALLRTVPGFGPLTIYTFIAEVGSILRFPSAKPLAAYAGCDPSLKVSAGHVTAHTRRRGNELLHSALVRAASSLINSKRGPLGEYGYSLSKRAARGGWKKACGAVARRIANFAYHVWRTGSPFSLDHYEFHLRPDVPDVPLERMQLGRAADIFARFGYTSSATLAGDYFAGVLATRKGIGTQCLLALRKWIEKNSTKSPRPSSETIPASPPSSPEPALPSPSATPDSPASSSSESSPAASGAPSTSTAAPRARSARTGSKRTASSSSPTASTSAPAPQSARSSTPASGPDPTPAAPAPASPSLSATPPTPEAGMTPTRRHRKSSPNSA